MWIFLWFIASAFIMGVFGWSLVILQQQKRAWSAFAKKHNLSYIPGRVVDAPAIKGAIFGYQIAFFPDTQATQDQRGQRYVTVLEFDLGEPGLAGGLIGSANYATFAAQQPYHDNLDIDYPGWDKTHIVRSDNAPLFRKYLTPARLEFIQGVMAMKNSTALMYFDDRHAILHIETTDPIRDAERFEKIVQKITGSFEKMKLTPGESA